MLRRDFCSSLAALTALATGPIANARLDDPVPDDPPPDAEPDEPEFLEALAQKLPHIHWNPGEHGVLLVVGAERNGPNGVVETALPLAPTRGKYRVNELARAFHRQLARFGNVTALVPELMTRFDPSARDAPDVLGVFERYQTFYASLTPSQWRALGSERGLFGRELDRSQRALFLSLLSDPLVVNDDGAPWWRWRGDERLELALRVRQEIGIDFLERGPNGTTHRDVGVAAAPPRQNLSVGPTFRGDSEPTFRLPNRPRPSDLNLASVSGSISLAGDSLTVRALVARCARASRRELHADARMGELSVFVLGESAAVADVLAALALSVTGVFRRLRAGDETAFVLTDDRVGLAQKLLGSQPLFNPRRLTADYRSLLGFARSGEADAGLIRALTEPPARKPGDEPGFAVNALPTPLRARVDEARRTFLAARSAGNESSEGDTPSPPALRDDRVELHLNTQTHLVLSDGREVPLSIQMPPFWPLRETLESPRQPAPSAWPDAFAARDAIVDPPASRDELPGLLSSLSSVGVTQVFFHVSSLLDFSKDDIAAAIAAGRRKNVRVGIRVPLWSMPAGATLPDAMEIDCALSGPVLSGDAPAVLGTPTSRRTPIAPGARGLLRLSESIVALARFPGLVALLVGDAFPPGYEGDEPDVVRPEPGSRLGFTPRNRLSFLRRHGFDPIDLPLFPVRVPASDPPFLSVAPFAIGRGERDPRSPVSLWERFLQEQASQARAALFETLRKTAPRLPLLLEPGFGADFVVSWTAPRTRAFVRPPDERNPTIAAHRMGKFARLRVGPDPADGSVFTSLLRKIDVESKKRGVVTWDGVLLDFSGRTPEKIADDCRKIATIEVRGT